MKKVLISAAIVAAFAGIFACSHDDDHSHEDGGAHSSAFASCQAILDACHEKDVGTGPVHDCHELGHDATSDAPCAAKKDECVKTCNAATTDDAGSDAGGKDAASEGGGDAGHDH
ncbi:MAG: hypothetical protein JST00_08530 [Deltaproteobacteria bacterium]|nr:hypothetical protein [Deltaproteobacteria bacterium]